jgi:hypothetical protein
MLGQLARPVRREGVGKGLEIQDLAGVLPYFVSSLADGAGEWRGSRNQRFIPNPGKTVAASQR